MSRDLTRAPPTHPPSQPFDCLAYLNIKGIEFCGKKLCHFWSSFLATVQCNSVKDLTFFCSVWIDKDDSTWSSALLTLSLTLVVCANATMMRSSTETIGANKIRYLLRMIMTFSLPIFKQLREFLRLISIEDALFDKALPSNPESGSTSSTGFSAYGGDEVSSISHFVDKDALACAA